jgi:hypothetical protein
MSRKPESPASIKASRANYALSFVCLFIGILLFAIIVLIAYAPNRADSFDADRVNKRYERLRELRAKDMQALGLSKSDTTTAAKNPYEVLDAKEGRVRLPIQRAMELVVRDYSKK